MILPATALALVAPGLSPVAQAQQATGEEQIEEIITTGTRRAERSASDSAVPIDVISGQEFENMGTADLNDMLKTAIPSYNLERQSISDAATLVRPATMRGLPPDNVLILVNGKRRHRSGVIAELGGDQTEGSQGADISAIPALAIKQLEVLRDGASAQYGSDAIAGVMNFVLRDDAQGATIEARTGEFMEGDGQLFQLMGNIGLPLGPDGFLNVTGSWMEQDPTSRSVQRTDAQALIDNGAPDQQSNVRQPYAQIWGGPEYRDNWNIFANMGIQLTPNQELYAFGNFGRRETEGGFFYRNPNNRGGVFTDGSLRAIADTNSVAGQSGFVSDCPAMPVPSLSNPTAVANDYTARQGLPEHCWLVNTVYPGGYTPQFGGFLKDASIVGGIRGEMNSGLLYDFSMSYGRNKASFFLANTWNPSNGPDGFVNGELQSTFDLGSYVQSENNINVDFVYPIKVDAFASDLNFAFGAEYRDEVFETILGEEASWEGGRFAFQNSDGTSCYDTVLGGEAPDGNCELNANGAPLYPLPNLSIGAHGFAGFNPPQAGLWGRSNIAFYTDFEADVTERLTLSAAIRYEDFESFGDTTNYKIAGRFEFTDNFAIRGSYNTGFRAPTPGQENVTKVSTTTINGELQQSGQIPPTNPIAQALGGEELRPEESENFSAGLVWDVTENFNLTFDYYNINVQDRISSTGNVDIRGLSANDSQFADINCPTAKGAPSGTVANSLAACLQETGVPGASDLGSVRFYTNDFETTAEGIDIVATFDTDWGRAGNGTLVAAWNWQQTTVDNAGEEVDRNKVVNLENRSPEHRGVFTYNHFLNNWRFLVRARYYDDFVVADYGDDPTDPGVNGVGYTLTCSVPGQPVNGDFPDNCYSGDTIFDAEVAYTFAEKYTVVVGAQNLFDEQGPEDIDNSDGSVGSGNKYSDAIPWGFEGGFWYLRLRAEFD
ncbi:MAG: TonB-dependent receptor [Gammaproteobacteria bacterium]|nr:TonB-dependent receptor [Gammaproteobacteria bacterium]